MSNKLGIVVIGATFVDIKGYPTTQYIPGGRNEGRVLQVHGGVCRNIVEDIANIELRPTFVSLVDRTGLGRDVVERLKEHKVNTDYVRHTEDGLGTWLAIFDNGGDVVASVSKRPDLAKIEEILVEHGDEIVSRADSIVVECGIETETLKKILGLAEKYKKKVYAPVTNMTIAMKRRDLIRRMDCLVCNVQEAGILFSENYDNITPEEMREVLAEKLKQTNIRSMVVTMGGEGAVFAELSGPSGICPASSVEVLDTTGAGDAFFSGVAVGLTYGKTLGEACEIGRRLASAVLVTRENVCPRFLPAEFGISFIEHNNTH